MNGCDSFTCPNTSLVILDRRQALVPDFPLAHFEKTRRADHRQGPTFSAPSRLEWSAVVNESWLPHQRLELENDLIATHILTTGEELAAQFLDGKKLKLG